ncbi:MAG: MerR family transcriptional regulator [Chitinophagaceae bacterium]|nr:MerR family transcriptional regulator [Chitinophagaceae bacterium]
MNAFTIKDLENLSGIKAHTIRIWEQRYQFLKPHRTTTNIRYYSNDELKTVLNIALLNKFGFKISHIDRMQPQEIREKILSMADARAIQERIINDLVQEMVCLEMERFEDILKNYIAAKGIERTVTQIIFPFLEKIGILWLTGHISPAQEHLVTNIIRQKLIVGIETASTHLKIDKTVLLFLPEGEHHELGLLYLYYLLKSRGAKTIYLGANVPVKDVQHVIRIKKPDIVFVHLTATASNFNFEKFLQNIKLNFGDTKTIVSGQLTQNYQKPVPISVEFKRSLPEVMELIASI